MIRFSLRKQVSALAGIGLSAIIWTTGPLNRINMLSSTAASPAVASNAVDLTPDRLRVAGLRFVPELPLELVQFETVFWDARDSESLRQLIAHRAAVQDKRILEIGTGTGLVSLCCLQHGAASVVATDINPQAVANARYNAQRLGLASRLEVRRVRRDSPSAYSPLRPGERFDLIISNPPWELGTPVEDADFAFLDPGFQLLDSLLKGLDQHLQPDGRALLAYGCVSAIDQLYRLAPQYGLTVTKLDDRQLDDLDELFLPGMLLEVRRDSR